MFFEGEAAKVGATPVTATGTVAETPTPTATPTPEGRHDRLRRHDAPRPRDHRRGDEVSRTYKILLVLVVAVLAGGGYWKMVPRAQARRGRRLEERVAVAQAQLAQSQALVNTYRGAQKDYKANYETVVRLGKAVPDRRRHALAARAARHVRQARRRRLRHDQRQRGGGCRRPSGTPAAPGAVNAGAFSAMPFSFGFTGTFASLGDFFARLERFVTLKGDAIAVNGRLVRIESLTLAPAEDGWPGLAAQIGASAYIVPETTDVAAAAAGAGTTRHVDRPRPPRRPPRPAAPAGPRSDEPDHRHLARAGPAQALARRAAARGRAGRRAAHPGQAAGGGSGRGQRGRVRRRCAAGDVRHGRHRQPSEAEGTTTKRRRTLGAKKDPFEPAPLPKAKKKKTKKTTAKASTSTTDDGDHDGLRLDHLGWRWRRHDRADRSGGHGHADRDAEAGSGQLHPRALLARGGQARTSRRPRWSRSSRCSRTTRTRCSSSRASRTRARSRSSSSPAP